MDSKTIIDRVNELIDTNEMELAILLMNGQEIPISQMVENIVKNFTNKINDTSNYKNHNYGTILYQDIRFTIDISDYCIVAEIPYKIVLWKKSIKRRIGWEIALDENAFWKNINMYLFKKIRNYLEKL